MFYASEYVTYYSTATGGEPSRSCSYKTFDNITDAINHNQKRYDEMFPFGVRGSVKVRGNVAGKLVADFYYDAPEVPNMHGKLFARHTLTVSKNAPF